MKYALYYLPLLIFILAISCHSPKSTMVSTTESSPIIFKFERGACFGYCPVYELITYEDGSFIYSGKRFVEQAGISSGLWNKDKLDSFINGMQELDWENYETYYESNIPDLPSITMTFKGHPVSFKENVPEELEALAIEVHEYIMGMDKGDQVYAAKEDHLSVESFDITLNSGCTIDADFQNEWSEFMASITPTSTDISNYRLTLKPYSISPGEAWGKLKRNPCIGNIQINP